MAHTNVRGSSGVKEAPFLAELTVSDDDLKRYQQKWQTKKRYRSQRPGLLPFAVGVESPLATLIVPTLLSLILFAIVVDLAFYGPLESLDRWALQFRIMQDSPWRSYGNIADGMGLRRTLLPLLILLSFWLRRRTGSWRPMLLTLIGFLLSTGIVGLMKIFFGRGAPIEEVTGLFQEGMLWPSGHAANVSMAWSLVVYYLRHYDRRKIGRSQGIAIVAIPSALMTGISLVLGYHWLTDLVAGVIVGLLVAAAVIHLDGGNPWKTRLQGHAVGDWSLLSLLQGQFWPTQNNWGTNGVDYVRSRQ